MSTSNNTRIAKNTIFLYLRQLFSMVISLYTVRVVLDVLGAEDYGIYNVVGGLVGLFSFLSSTMSTATQRFLSFELGKEKGAELQKIFTISLYSYLVVIIVIVALSETIGLWFLSNKLVIPPERMFSAQVVYQLTILSFVSYVIYSPFDAALVAMERMDIYAYGGIASSIINLIAALILDWYNFSDALIVYAFFILMNSVIVCSYYISFCRNNFSFCKINRDLFEWEVMKKLTSFAFWNMVATICSLLRNQGVNMLINMFFNPVVNAARGIAMQISTAISNFSYHFYTAVRPQLVKYYSSGDLKKMLDLGCQSSRFSFLLLFVISAPVFCDADKILDIWLKDVPVYTVLFTRIILVSTLLEILVVPLDHMIQATGNIKKIFNVVSFINILNIPFSYLLLKFGHAPESTMYMSIVLLLVGYGARLFACKRMMRLNISSYFVEVIYRLSLVLVFFLVWIYLYDLYGDKLMLFISLPINFLFVLLLSLYIGMSFKERMYMFDFIKKKIQTFTAIKIKNSN